MKQSLYKHPAQNVVRFGEGKKAVSDFSCNIWYYSNKLFDDPEGP